MFLSAQYGIVFCWTIYWIIQSKLVHPFILFSISSVCCLFNYQAFHESKFQIACCHYKKLITSCCWYVIACFSDKDWIQLLIFYVILLFRKENNINIISRQWMLRSNFILGELSFLFRGQKYAVCIWFSLHKTGIHSI